MRQHDISGPQSGHALIELFTRRLKLKKGIAKNNPPFLFLLHVYLLLNDNFVR